jgi:hypothetical protein
MPIGYSPGQIPEKEKEKKGRFERVRRWQRQRAAKREYREHAQYLAERRKLAIKRSKLERKEEIVKKKRDIYDTKERIKRTRPPGFGRKLAGTFGTSLRSELTPSKAKKRKKRKGRRRRAAPRVRAGAPRYDPWSASPW